jgi:hypothetical protein
MELAQQIKLQEWNEALVAATEAKKAIEKEQALRKEIMALFFPAPEEGTNKVDLGAGWTLKATHKIDRKIDEAALPAVFQQLREMGVNPDLLVRAVPALETKAYKSLAQINPDASRVFEQALTIKPGSPTLELIPPKAA